MPGDVSPAGSKFAGPWRDLQRNKNLFIRCNVFFIRLFIVAKEKKSHFSAYGKLWIGPARALAA